MPAHGASVLAALALAALPVAGGLGAAPAPEDLHAIVLVFDYGYRDIDSGHMVSTIPAGGFVQWNWTEGAHSVTHGVHAMLDPVTGSFFDSGVLVPTEEGTIYIVEFWDTGEFPYRCRLHDTMRGVVRVT